MIVGWMISSRLKSKFKQYSQTHLTKDLSGAEVARLMLADHGIHDVQVISVDGELTDHYNPANKTVNLSQDVYNGRNAAAAAIASHECGHAVQHATAYSMLEFRSAMVPIQNISASVLNFVMMAMLFGSFFAGAFLPWKTALMILIVCYGVFALFALITLPVEFDASRRALVALRQDGIITSAEEPGVRSVLNAAALTYVAAALMALLQLLRLVLIARNSDD